jgi:integrase
MIWAVGDGTPEKCEMGRKAKPAKRTITVVVNGAVVPVVLHPPHPPRRAWYAYWPGLVASKSTGQTDFEQAALAAEDMVRNKGKRPCLAERLLSDEEFEAIQRAHYDRKQDPQARARAKKSLESCLEAIAAFREITGISPVVSATPDDCAAFQRTALRLPKSWRLSYPNARKKGVSSYSAHTVLRWSRALQAAFERASINGGKKCIRGVVDNAKLLSYNPWKAFTWIEGADKPIRQFTAEELGSILDYFGSKWQEISVAAAAAKSLLWLWCRLSELVNLKWDDLRIVGTEYHFQIIGKWAVEKWARIPTGLHKELFGLKTASPYVFAAYTCQLRNYYNQRGLAVAVANVGEEYVPRAFGDWLQERIPEWAAATGRPHATPHVFRKTALQHARRGEDLNRLVAQDARVGTSVMMRHYVTEREEELRHASNRTYARILASLPQEIATRYGYVPESQTDDLEARLEAAAMAKDWKLVADLAQQLAGRVP